MTAYATKVLTGRRSSDEEWNEHVLSTHQAAPGMTPQLFAQREVLDGLDSYELLARTLGLSEGPIGAIVDLGCGDGHLIDRLLPRLGPATQVWGVDMSAPELAIARSRFARHDNVHLLCERAQALSLPPRSIDVVLCHVALMVMRPITPVIEEMGRILKNGGLFAAVTASSRDEGGPMLAFLPVIRSFFQEHFAGMSSLPSCDGHERSREGLLRLFSRSRGFASLEIRDEYDVHQRYSVEDVWLHFRDSYLVSVLDDHLKARLRERLVDVASRCVQGSPFVEFRTPIQLIIARREPAARADSTWSPEGGVRA